MNPDYFTNVEIIFLIIKYSAKCKLISYSNIYPVSIIVYNNTKCNFIEKRIKFFFCLNADLLRDNIKFDNCYLIPK